MSAPTMRPPGAELLGRMLDGQRRATREAAELADWWGWHRAADLCRDAGLALTDAIAALPGRDGVAT